MAEFDPNPPVSPMFKGLVFAVITLLVGMAAWALIGGAVALILWVLP